MGNLMGNKNTTGTFLFFFFCKNLKALFQFALQSLQCKEAGFSLPFKCFDLLTTTCMNVIVLKKSAYQVG